MFTYLPYYSIKKLTKYKYMKHIWIWSEYTYTFGQQVLDYFLFIVSSEAKGTFALPKMIDG